MDSDLFSLIKPSVTSRSSFVSPQEKRQKEARKALEKAEKEEQRQQEKAAKAAARLAQQEQKKAAREVRRHTHSDISALTTTPSAAFENRHLKIVDLKCECGAAGGEGSEGGGESGEG